MNKTQEATNNHPCRFRLQAVGDAMYAIGGKWKMQIIVAMLEGTNRFNELLRVIDGLSSKVLASELKELEMNGFIKRTVSTGPPVVVVYELTEYSKTLEDVLKSLFEWGVKHRKEVRK
ncbi:winged helix-turn-helix transcriptional regulator [Spirosoma jeollabukense]